MCVMQRIRTKRGYVWVMNPYPDCKYMYEHRYVVEQHLGRRLTSLEWVHHINGVKDDNRLENLQVISASAHTRLHMTKEPVVKLCAVCNGPFGVNRRHPQVRTCGSVCGYKARGRSIKAALLAKQGVQA